VNKGGIGDIDAAGYSASGGVRTADLLSAAGLLAYDGVGVICNPVLFRHA